MKNILLVLVLLLCYHESSYAQTFILYSYPVVNTVLINQPVVVPQVQMVPIITMVPVPTIVQPVIVHQPVVVMQKRFCCLPWFNQYYYGQVSPPVIRY